MQNFKQSNVFRVLISEYKGSVTQPDIEIYRRTGLEPTTLVHESSMLANDKLDAVSEIYFPSHCMHVGVQFLIHVLIALLFYLESGSYATLGYRCVLLECILVEFE